MKIFLFILSLLYPLLVYKGLAEFSIRVVSLLLVLLLAFRFFITVKVKSYREYAIALFAVGLLSYSFIFEQKIGLLLYPVIINISLAAVFAFSLYNGPTAIERIARLKEPNLPLQAIRYTRTVTKVWLVFFVFNALVASYTVYLPDIKYWTIYNGLISYLLMGLLFLGEFIVRQRVKKHVEN